MGQSQACRLRMYATLAFLLGLASVGGTELILLLTGVLLVFGAERIPRLARDLGSGVREFKGGISGAGGEKDDLAQNGNGS